MIKAMNMKACDFIGKNLSNDTANVILLFESRKSGRLSNITEDSLDKFLDSTFFREHLISHIELLNWISSKNIRAGNVNPISSEDIVNEFNRS